MASLKATSKEPCVMVGHHFFQLNRVEVFLDAHSTEVLVLRSFLFLFILFSLGIHCSWKKFRKCEIFVTTCVYYEIAEAGSWPSAYIQCM